MEPRCVDVREAARSFEPSSRRIPELPPDHTVHSNCLPRYHGQIRRKLHAVGLNLRESELSFFVYPTRYVDAPHEGGEQSLLARALGWKAKKRLFLRGMRLPPPHSQAACERDWNR